MEQNSPDMFRFTEWFAPPHMFSKWEAHFVARGVKTEIRTCPHGMVALFREGEESIAYESLPTFDKSRLDFEIEHGCECGWRQNWVDAKGRPPTGKAAAK